MNVERQVIPGPYPGAKFISCEEESDPLYIPEGDDTSVLGKLKLSCDKGIQISKPIKKVDKTCQTKKVKVKCEELVFNSHEDVAATEEDEKSDTDSSYSCSSSSDASGSANDFDDGDHEKGILMKVKRNSQFYLGLSHDTYFLIELLVENIRAPQSHILIVLKKIRLNDSFTRLAIDFSISKGYISKIFNKTIKCISHYMKELIYFPDPQKIAPHACVDVKLIPIFDDAVIIACGLVNLQNVLIKH
nr:unnamed protein product [Callosobruchus analis]